MKSMLPSKVLKTNCIAHHRKEDPRVRVALASHALASSLTGAAAVHRSTSGDVGTRRHLLHRDESHCANQKLTLRLLRDLHKNSVEVVDTTTGKKEGALILRGKAERRPTLQQL